MNAEQLEAQLAQTQDPVQRVELMLRISDKRRRDEPVWAEQYTEQAVALALQTGDEQLYARSLYILGICRLTAGNYRRALPPLCASARVYRTHANVLMHARALQYVAMLYGEMGEVERALRIHRRNLRVYSRVGNEEDRALTWLYVGRVYERQGRLAKALHAFGRAYDMWKAKGEHRRIAQITGCLAAVYFLLRDFKMAYTYHQQGLELCRAADDRTGMAIAMKNLGVVCSEMGDHQQALEWETAALHLFRDLGRVNDEAAVLGSMGVTYSIIGDYRRAHTCLKQALPVARRTGGMQLYCHLLVSLARLYGKQQRYTQALRYVHRAKNIGWDTGETPVRCSIMQALTEIYEGMGQYAKAFECFREREQYGEMICSTAVQRAIAVQENRMEIRRMKQELTDLARKNSELELAAQVQARELAAQAIYLMKKQEFLRHLNRRVTELIRATPPTRSSVLRTVLQELQRGALPENEWQELEDRFRHIDDEYLARLQRRFPQLSRTESKVCLLLKMNLSTKEIADLLCVSSRTVDFHRNNIRKKVGLEPGRSITTFLMAV